MRPFRTYGTFFYFNHNILNFSKDSWQKEETFEDCPAVLDDWQKKIQEKAAKKQVRMEKALKRREEKAAQKAEEKKTNPPKKRGRKPKAE